MAGAEQLLLEAEFEDLKLLWSSSNYVYLATLCAGDGQEIAAVYKPESGETPLWDFPTGTLYAREVAAYQLSQLLGWPFVPPTVVRDGPQGVGSLQLYVSHERASHFFEQRDDPALVPQLQRMAVFDFVANNADRKGGHCLLDEQGRIWGIDHGLCFHREYKLRTVIWDWAEQPISDEWLGDVERAATAVAGEAEETEALNALLSPDEIGALLGTRRPPAADARHAGARAPPELPLAAGLSALGSQPGSWSSWSVFPSGSAKVATQPPQRSCSGVRENSTPRPERRRCVEAMSSTAKWTMMRSGSRAGPWTSSWAATLRRKPPHSKLANVAFSLRGGRPRTSR